MPQAKDGTAPPLKKDKGKERWDLLPIEIEQVVRVLTHGSYKYEDYNWQKTVKENSNRYSAALMRHFWAWRKGEVVDFDSNLPHLAHLICCALFLMWSDNHP